MCHVSIQFIYHQIRSFDVCLCLQPIESKVDGLIGLVPYWRGAPCSYEFTTSSLQPPIKHKTTYHEIDVQIAVFYIFLFFFTLLQGMKGRINIDPQLPTNIYDLITKPKAQSLTQAKFFHWKTFQLRHLCHLLRWGQATVILSKLVRLGMTALLKNHLVLYCRHYPGCSLELGMDGGAGWILILYPPILSP